MLHVSFLDKEPGKKSENSENSRYDALIDSASCMSFTNKGTVDWTDDDGEVSEKEKTVIELESAALPVAITIRTKANTLITIMQNKRVRGGRWQNFDVG